MQAGNLRARFDAIVFADEVPDAIENGHAAGTMPPEFTGGLGAKGAEALRAFTAAEAERSTGTIRTTTGLPAIWAISRR